MNTKNMKGKSILSAPHTKRQTPSGRIFRSAADPLSGSLTIEAAMVLPLFLFAIITLLSVMDALTAHINTQMKLYDTARCAAVYGYGIDAVTDGRQGDWIRLKLVYPAGRNMGGFGHKLILENHVNIHIFNGWSGDYVAGYEKDEEYVYITDDGEVFHRRRDCKYLNVSVRAVSGGSVSSLRNDDGSRFHICPVCGKGYNKADISSRQVFVTDWGNRYHMSLSCSGLKRSIKVVPISQAGGRRPCSGCG